MDNRVGLTRALARFSSAADETVRAIDGAMSSFGDLANAIQQSIAHEQQLINLEVAQHPDIAELNVFLDALYDLP